MSYAFAALDIAKRQLGRKEEGGENHGDIVEWSCAWATSTERYQRAYDKNLLAWCAGFTGRCFLEAGLNVRGLWSLEADKLWDRLVEEQVRHKMASIVVETWIWQPGLLTPQRLPQPGDLFFLMRGTKRQIGHVGFVELLTETGYQSVEGNHADKVARDQHVLNDPDLFGFVHIEG